jgi:hypothetical protein
MLKETQRLKKLFQEAVDLYEEKSNRGGTIDSKTIAITYKGLIAYVNAVEEELSSMRNRISLMEDRLPDRWDRGL